MIVFRAAIQVVQYHRYSFFLFDDTFRVYHTNTVMTVKLIQLIEKQKFLWFSWHQILLYCHPNGSSCHNCGWSLSLWIHVIHKVLYMSSIEEKTTRDNLATHIACMVMRESGFRT